MRLNRVNAGPGASTATAVLYSSIEQVTISSANLGSNICAADLYIGNKSAATRLPSQESVFCYSRNDKTLVPQYFIISINTLWYIFTIHVAWLSLSLNICIDNYAAIDI